MGRKKQTVPSVNLSPLRAARLYKLLNALSVTPQTRMALRRKLRVDVRGFYRDVESLRKFVIEIETDSASRYLLAGSMDDALARFPLPDLGLNVREAMQLVSGVASAQTKLKRKIDAFLNGTSLKRGKK